MDFNEAIGELIQGTNFEVNTASTVLTSSPYKVRTPIEAINCLLGGGIPLNGVYHTWGPPKGGKSTWLYQTMGIFQKEYPTGLSIILDQESSADPARLRMLGVDTDKVLRLPCTSIESGFIALMKMIDNKQKNDRLKTIPIFVIWDTISRGKAQDDSTQSRMNAQDRARIIKNYMPELSAKIEKQPFILGLINQVVYSVDRYGNRHSEAGGGVALQHDNHMSMCITPFNTDYDETGSFVVGKWSKMDIDKSKIGPEMIHIPFKIDTLHGGCILERESFIWFMTDTFHYIENKGGWFSITPIVKKFEGSPITKWLWDNGYDKKYRYNQMMETFSQNDTLYNILRLSFMDYLTRMFSLQADIIRPYLNQVYDEVMAVVDPKPNDPEESDNSNNESNSTELDIENEGTKNE